MVFRLRPTCKLSDLWTLALGMSVSKGLTQARETTLKDSSLSLALMSQPIGPALNSNSRAVIVLPTSEISRKELSLLGSVGVQQAFVFKPATVNTFEATYVFKAQKDFYQYRVSTLGESNQSLGIVNALGLAYLPNDKWRLDMAAGPGLSWTYEGNSQTLYSINEELSYTFNAALSTAIGHTNAGEAFKDNGRSANISLFNGYSSTFYGTLTYTY